MAVNKYYHLQYEQKNIILIIIFLNKRTLGSLSYMKIWHDNSGKGDLASWFLKYVIVHDLQTRKKYYFICNNWLAVEKGDEKLEKELFVALDPQKSELKYLLQKELNHNINDSHIWLSTFKKPVQSSFTRLDRVTCCFVLLYLSCSFNILYFNYTNSSNSHSLLNFGLFNITLEQVIIFLNLFIPHIFILIK